MLLAFQFLLRVDRRVEGEGLPGIAGHCGQRDACSFDGDVVAVVVAAVFLRLDVVFMQVGDRGAEDAVVAGVVLVDVGLAGTHAIVGDLTHGFRKEEAKADSGQGRNLGILAGVHIQTDTSVRIYGDCVIHAQDRLDGHGTDRLLDRNFNAAAVLLASYFVRSGHCVIQALPFPQIGRGGVVVRGSPPEVEVHGEIQQLFAAEFHGCEEARQGIQAVDEVVALHNEEATLLKMTQNGMLH